MGVNRAFRPYKVTHQRRQVARLRVIVNSPTPMARRTINDEADARACITALEASGMELRAWVAAHGIDGRSLRAWMRKLQESANAHSGEAPIRMVELVAERTCGSSLPPLASVDGVVVRVGGIEIELGPNFDDDTLRRVLRVAATC